MIMTPVTHQNVQKTPETGLLAPLQRLDCRLQQTIEVAQLLQGTAFQHYCLGSIKPAQQPAEAVAAESSLSQLAKTFGLSPFEVGVVVMAIAPELDRRYERLYACLQEGLRMDSDKPLRKPTIDLALNLLGGGEAEQRVQQLRFAAQMPLARLLQPIDHAPQTLRQQTLQLNPLVSRYLLGQRSLPPSLASCCRVKWPKKSALASATASVIDPSAIDYSAISQALSHRLMVVGFQPSVTSLPLSVQFVGCSVEAFQGNHAVTWQSAEGLAIAMNAPLLQINLTQLVHSVGLTETKSFEAIQQVLLQGQLWNAVLYVESTAALAEYKPIHPGVIQKLSVQLTTYPGMSVFTDTFATNSCSEPEGNGPKESGASGAIMTLFSKNSPVNSSPEQYQKANSAPGSFSRAAAYQVENFRLMLMQSFPEFS
jgi:hypothetical protein